MCAYLYYLSNIPQLGHRDLKPVVFLVSFAVAFSFSFQEFLPFKFFYGFYMFIYCLWFVTLIDKSLFELLTILTEVIRYSTNPFDI